MASPSRKGAKRLSDRTYQKLGLHKSSAQRKLVRILLFEYVKNSGDNFCWQCGEEITELDKFSIEHKKPWSCAEDPKQAYFDLDNVTFSHLSCNSQKIRNSPHRRKLTAFDLDIAKDRLVRNPAGFRYVRLYKQKEVIKYMARVPHWKNGKRIKYYFGKARETALEADEIMIRLYGKKAITNQKLGLIPLKDEN